MPAQEKLLKGYAEKNSFQIEKVFSISESASGKKQREIFSEMMSHVQKQDIKIIICEKVDRLTRNFKDAVMIDEWLEKDEERQVHLVKDSLTLHKNSRSQEKLNWGIRILFAKNLIDNLSEEVKKGQKEKIAEGWLPTTPPVGYMTVGEKGHKIHVIDKTKAPLVQKMFEFYASGQYSLKKLSEVMYEEGLRGVNDNKIGKSRTHELLRNPFYIGKNVWNGQETQGKQETLISDEIFEQVSQLLTRKNTPKYSKHFFLFKALLKCGECGGVVAWEIGKGHIYGHCNHYRECAQTKWVKEKNIEDQLLIGFEKLEVKNPRLAEWIRKALKESHQDQITYHASSMNELTQREDQIKQRLDKLYDDKLDNKITEDFYQKKFQQYSAELKSVTDSIKKQGDSTIDYYELGVNIYDLAQRAKELYLKSQMERRRQLISLVFSNLIIDNGKLFYTYSKPFEILSKAVNATNKSTKMTKNDGLVKKIFEPSKNTENMAQRDFLYALRPVLLPGLDSDQRPYS